jgi:ribosome-binding protein aMBF1 (putative translation factor)
MGTWKQFKQQLLADPEVKAEYDKLQPEFAVLEAIIKARQEKGLTQAQLAQKMNTTQSAIARLESGNANPSINFLKRFATAIGARLEIRFT